MSICIVIRKLKKGVILRSGATKKPNHCMAQTALESGACKFLHYVQDDAAFYLKTNLTVYLAWTSRTAYFVTLARLHTGASISFRAKELYLKLAVGMKNEGNIWIFARHNGVCVLLG